MSIRCIPIATCADCPFRKRNYGIEECSRLNFQPLPKLEVQNGIVTPVPDWCPLPPHPSFARATQGAAPATGETE